MANVNSDINGKRWTSGPFRKTIRPMRKRPLSRLFLRQWRKFRGLSQERLADLAGLTQGLISQLERGESDYSGDTLQKLARALACEPGDLIERPPEEDNPLSVWRKLKPTQRRQALRLLHALQEE